MLTTARIRCFFLIAVPVIVLGCQKSSMPEPIERASISEDMKPLPFEHPATAEVRRLYLALDFHTEEDYRKLSRRDRYLCDVIWFEDQVMNGGVDQFLYNSTGDHVSETLEALKAVGAEEAHRLLKHACDLFPDGRPSANLKTRHDQLREITGPKHIDDLIPGEIEYDLYQHVLDYYHSADPNAR